MRRKVLVGYPRGEETRARILSVALHLFGTKGFDSVSTREVAAAAEVPPASLRYYFVNKDGLYIACLEHVQALTFALMEPALCDAEAMIDKADADCELLIDSFCALLDALMDSMIGGSDNGAAALFTIRHDLPSDGEAGKLTGNGIAARRMLACFVKIMTRISGNTLDPESALIVAGLINGQLTNIYVRRNRLAEFGWEITPDRLQWMKATVRKHARAILQTYRVED